MQKLPPLVTGNASGVSERKAPSAPAGRYLYPVKEACALLGGLSRSKLYELFNEKRIRPVHIGTRTYLPADEIDRFVASLAEDVLRGKREPADREVAS